jgi:hypothetical protein
MTQTRPTITLVNGTEKEQLLQSQLLKLFDRYPLDKWLYTEDVQIEEGVIPHSHPVLTLSPETRGAIYLGHPEQLLSCYIHEQLHWFMSLEDLFRDRERVNAELRARYPNLPVGPLEGCRSEYSNYLHIVVNFLEYQGLRELFGEARAKAMLEHRLYYRAIYEIVLSSGAELERLFTECGLVLPERPPVVKRFRTPSKRSSNA